MHITDHQFPLAAAPDAVQPMILPFPDDHNAASWLTYLRAEHLFQLRILQPEDLGIVMHSPH